MRGAIPPLPNTPSWRGDRIKKAQVKMKSKKIEKTIKFKKRK
jgi:hypothetical protein